jgi:hypothetical protein
LGKDVAETDVTSDEDDAMFAAQIGHQISSGAIAPPPGGPLTPAEIHEVEMHPWPGHTMQQAVERLRAQQSSCGDSSSAS